MKTPTPYADIHGAHAVEAAFTIVTSTGVLTLSLASGWFSRGRQRVVYRATFDDGTRSTVVETGDDYGPSPLVPWDSAQSAMDLANWLAVRPGDTEPAFFAGWTAARHLWADEHAEALTLALFDLTEAGEEPTSIELTYCDDCGVVDPATMVAELTHDINAACEGESARLCDDCLAVYEEGGTIADRIGRFLDEVDAYDEQTEQDEYTDVDVLWGLLRAADGLLAEAREKLK